MRGELGHGEFIYDCFNSTDIWCLDDDEPDFPGAIAVGARFKMSFEPDTVFDSDATVVSASDETISGSAQEFMMEREGRHGLFARELSGEIVDVVHVAGRPVERVLVTLSREGASRRIEIPTGRSTRLTAHPLSADDELLAGALRYSWRSADRDVFVVGDVDRGLRVSVQGVAPGNGELIISLLGEEHVIDVTVVEDVDIDAGVTDSGPINPLPDSGFETDAGEEEDEDGGQP